MLHSIAAAALLPKRRSVMSSKLDRPVRVADSTSSLIENVVAHAQIMITTSPSPMPMV
jgi:hypothetical protein